MAAMLRHNHLFLKISGTSFLYPSRTAYKFVIRFLVSLGH